MSEWISVKDRLPEKSGDYLVCSVHNGKALPRSVYFDTSAGWYDSAITHWMPLPEPPKESEDDERGNVQQYEKVELMEGK